MKTNIIIPADVGQSEQQEFIQNYQAITKKTDNLFLFAGDQKIEHLNKDFIAEGMPPEINNPQHLFEIASKGTIGAFATQLGLISRYGRAYPNINYIAKLNSKTNIIPTELQDPKSELLWSVEDAVDLKVNAKLPIRGIGFTVYLGSKYEADMLMQAAQAVHRAHQFGLVAVLWMYPRGKNVKNEKDENIIAGAAGVAACLGADFAKINVPEGQDSKTRAQKLQQAVAAAGNTKIICSGGKKRDKSAFLQELQEQLTIAGTSGCATGRNIFQKPLEQAVSMTNDIANIVY
ncbi:aldolase [bacterium]|nr:aldolase [bacterium]